MGQGQQARLQQQERLDERAVERGAHPLLHLRGDGAATGEAHLQPAADEPAVSALLFVLHLARISRVSRAYLARTV